MKPINIKKLKPGDIILTFDSNLKSWIKCKIIRIGTYRITLEYIKGSMKGIPWYENVSKIRNSDYYKMDRLFDLIYYQKTGPFYLGNMYWIKYYYVRCVSLGAIYQRNQRFKLIIIS